MGLLCDYENFAKVRSQLYCQLSRHLQVPTTEQFLRRTSLLSQNPHQLCSCIHNYAVIEDGSARLLA